MNHLAHLIYAQQQNVATIDDELLIASSTPYEIEVIRELKPLLCLPADTLANLIGQTNPPDWTLRVEHCHEDKPPQSLK